MRGSVPTREGRRIRWVRSRRTRGACTTCTATCGSGVRIGRGDRYYATSPMDDPTGPSGGSYRVYRGGCWRDDASSAGRRAATGRGPDDRRSDHGFRLARSVSFPVGAASPLKSGAESPQSKDRPTPKPSAPNMTPPAARPAPDANKPTQHCRRRRDNTGVLKRKVNHVRSLRSVLHMARDSA